MVDNSKYLHTELTKNIIRCYYKVYNTLGYGFLEKVYEKALKKELEKAGHIVESQKPIKVYYDNEIVGDYFADLVVDNKVILELKAAEAIVVEHEVQLLNYLRATDIEVGLLFNFGKEPQFARRVFENKFKKS
jgi:GxxExxY protein